MTQDISKLDKSCISNPKSEVAHWTGSRAKSNPIFRDFGFEMQDSSNFEISDRGKYFRTQRGATTVYFLVFMGVIFGLLVMATDFAAST